MNDKQNCIKKELWDDLLELAKSHLRRFPRLEGSASNYEATKDFYQSIYTGDGKAILDELEKKKLVQHRFVRPEDHMPLEAPGVKEWVLRHPNGTFFAPTLRFIVNPLEWDNPWPKKQKLPPASISCEYGTVPQLVCTFDPPGFHAWLRKKYPLTRRYTKSRTGDVTMLYEARIVEQDWWKKRYIPAESGLDGIHWSLKVLFLYLPQLKKGTGGELMGVRSHDSFLADLIKLPKKFYDIEEDEDLLQEEIEQEQIAFLEKLYSPPELEKITDATLYLARKIANRSPK